MKTFPVLLAILLMGLLRVSADPVVSNVFAQQMEGTKSMRITYDLETSVPAAITVQASSDDGATWTVPVLSLSGNGIGSEVSSGTSREILWNAGADWQGQVTQQLRVRVRASHPVTRIITLSGDLSFGNVTVGQSAARTLTIANSGNASLSVSSIRYPAGFSGDWNSGTIAPDGSQAVTVTFAPTAEQEYSGNLAVTSDASSGSATLAISGTGEAIPLAGFVLIPAGAFMMGDASADGYDWERPVHEVFIDSYLIGIHEVSKSLWDEIRNWALQSGLGYEDLPDAAAKAADHPVHSISWFDAVKWLNAWSEMDGLTAVYTIEGAVMRSGQIDPVINYQANGYRLPSEAEWEKAARGLIQGRRFPWGNAISHINANYYAIGGRYFFDISSYPSFTYHPQFNDGIQPYTSPVGSFAPNSFGLFDVIGNVWEWCNDFYNSQSNYYTVSPLENPTGPESGSSRVFRGGSWNYNAFYARVSNRDTYFGPPNATRNRGFRPARSVVVSAEDGLIKVQGGSLPADSDLSGTAVATFYMGRYEVTWGEWQAVRAYAVANGYDIGSRGEGCADDHPVHTVAWFDVVKWCNAKSEMEGLAPVYTVAGSPYRTGEPDHTTIAQNLSASGYRLPTEAEWEFAARGGTQTNGYTYSGSNDLDSVGWYLDNSGGAACDLSSGRGTWPVGQKAANELGLYDMSGNLWEWCWDQYLGSYRRIRGGSWNFHAYNCTVSYRGNPYPDHRSYRNGFRMARSSGE